jgi:hypothetical protein
MRKTVLAAAPKISVKDITAYLTTTVKEKKEFMEQQKAHVSNPSVREMYLKAEAVHDYADYMLMAIKANAPHYLR